MRDIAGSLGNARLINRLNKIKVVNLIRNNDSVSRADVARESGLSIPTVSRIVEDLMAEGLVREIGEGPSQKRPPAVDAPILRPRPFYHRHRPADDPDLWSPFRF